MNINLYIALHQDRNPDRARELETCLESNLRAGYSCITVMCEEKDRPYCESVLFDKSWKDLERYAIWGGPKPCDTTVKSYDHRPTLSDYVNLINETPEAISVISNSDIYILPGDLQRIKDLPWTDDLFLALSRWDIAHDSSSVLLSRGDSQDVWIWQGKSKITADACPLGFPGVDGRIAWEAKAAGYRVYNPSRDIQFKHLHHVKVFNYRQDGKPDGGVLGDQICPEPYHFVNPCCISDIN